MKAKEILELSLKSIKREDVLKTSLFIQNGTNPTDEQQEVFDDLFFSVNDALMSISYIYLPQKMKEEVMVQNGQISYQTLSKTLIDVVRIKDKYGVLQKFLTYPTYVKCPNGLMEITYTFQPSVVTNLTDDLEFENKNISSQMIMFSVVANFYLKRGLFDESEVWEKMFKEQVLECKRKKYVPEMKKRLW